MTPYFSLHLLIRIRFNQIDPREILPRFLMALSNHILDLSAKHLIVRNLRKLQESFLNSQEY